MLFAMYVILRPRGPCIRVIAATAEMAAILSSLRMMRQAFPQRFLPLHDTPHIIEQRALPFDEMGPQITLDKRGFSMTALWNGILLFTPAITYS